MKFDGLIIHDLMDISQYAIRNE